MCFSVHLLCSISKLIVCNQLLNLLFVCCRVIWRRCSARHIDVSCSLIRQTSFCVNIQKCEMKLRGECFISTQSGRHWSKPLPPARVTQTSWICVQVILAVRCLHSWKIHSSGMWCCVSSQQCGYLFSTTAET